MKVLFSNSLKPYLGPSLLTWLITGLTGSFFAWETGYLYLGFVPILAISLIFSLPALLGMLVIFLAMEFFHHPPLRVAWALLSVLGLCAMEVCIFFLFAKSYTGEFSLMKKLIIPYALVAPPVYLVISASIILRKPVASIRDYRIF